jgi:hypothetical protein
MEMYVPVKVRVSVPPQAMQALEAQNDWRSIQCDAVSRIMSLFHKDGPKEEKGVVDVLS